MGLRKNCPNPSNQKTSIDLGPRIGWRMINYFVRRKPVESLTKTQDLEKVRDPGIREILRDHLKSHDIDPDQPGKIPGDVFKGTNIPHMKSGVAIKRIRMTEQSDTIRPVSDKRKFQYIKPGSNHHMVIYDLSDKNVDPILEDGEAKRDGNVIPMIDVAKETVQLRKEKAKITLINKNLGLGKQFVMSLSINEMFMLKMPDGSHMLHRIQKLSDGSIILRPHTYAGKVSDSDKPPFIQRRTPNTLRGYKVTVDRLGRLRRAKD